MVVREEKRWFRELLTDLVRRIGVRDPDRVGAELMLLVDGANSKVLVDGDHAAAALAREAAITLLRADLPGQQPQRPGLGAAPASLQ